MQAGRTRWTAAPAQAAGCYREAPVAPALRRDFGCAWVHSLPPGESRTVLVVPDGRMDLLWSDGAASIAGPDREPQPATLQAGSAVVGLRFRPAVAAAWLRVPAAELLNRRVPLAEVAPAAARRLAGLVGDRRDPAAVARVLQEGLARELAEAPAGPAALRHAFALVEQGGPPDRPLLPWLCASLEMTERTLRRRFLDEIGYGPKTLDRILRFQRFLSLARRPGDGGAAGMAAASGYADQAHLAREVRRLSGQTPGGILRLLGG